VIAVDVGLTLTRFGRIAAFVFSFIFLGHGYVGASPLARVEVLHCGVQENGPAFSNIDENGRWGGFYTNFCRATATATAVLGDAEAVELVLVGTDDRFSALRDGDYHILMSSATWTPSRDIDLLTFMLMYLLDAQGVLSHKASKC
jgi:general L-amino acid transport system substrate-binding protein